MTVLLVIAEWRGWKAVAGDMDPPGTPFSDNLQATLRQLKHVKEQNIVARVPHLTDKTNTAKRSSPSPAGSTTLDLSSKIK